MTSPLVLFAGQSNAVGYGAETFNYSPTWRVQMWTDTNGDGFGDTFNYLNPPYNTGGYPGPEVAFATRWLGDNPSGILYMAKIAAGGSSLAYEWRPGDLLYETAKRAANDMLSNLDRASLDGVFWMQGESDAINGYGASYEANLTSFISNVRAEWMHDPEGSFVFGRITDSPALGDTLAVRVAQWTVDQLDDNALSFRTIDFGRTPDTVHYDWSGLEQLGVQYHNHWIMLQ